MNEYMKKRQQQIFDGRPIPEKKKHVIKQVSDKRAAKLAEQKGALGEDETAKEKWFAMIRKKLVGTCQCGCARKSSKFEDDHFRSSCAHIFPKKDFESVMFHPLNYVERNFWEGCHTNMDNRSMDKWPMFADWDDIKAKFHELAPLLTEQERKKKFYTHLEKLVFSN